MSFEARAWFPVYVWHGRGYGIDPEGPREGMASIWDKRSGRAIVKVGDGLFEGEPLDKWRGGLDSCAYSRIPETRYDRQDSV